MVVPFFAKGGGAVVLMVQLVSAHLDLPPDAPFAPYVGYGGGLSGWMQVHATRALRENFAKTQRRTTPPTPPPPPLLTPPFPPEHACLPGQLPRTLQEDGQARSQRAQAGEVEQEEEQSRALGGVWRGSVPGN